MWCPRLISLGHGTYVRFSRPFLDFFVGESGYETWSSGIGRSGTRLGLQSYNFIIGLNSQMIRVCSNGPNDAIFLVTSCMYMPLLWFLWQRATIRSLQAHQAILHTNYVNVKLATNSPLAPLQRCLFCRSSLSVLSWIQSATS